MKPYRKMDIIKSLRAVGQPLKRKEDERLITGKGRFTDDFAMPGQVWAAMVRSPFPHARILGIDGSAAMEMEGVLGVFTGADALADVGAKDIFGNGGPTTSLGCGECA